MKQVLVFDKSCPFCYGLARYLKKKFKIQIQPNTKRLWYINSNKAKKDVHFITIINKHHIVIFSGTDAVVQVLKLKFKNIDILYSFFIFNKSFKFLYFILKKVRKYIL
jgi:predicted DCC family thiol-disulfide oxidoreductase YuxK